MRRTSSDVQLRNRNALACSRSNCCSAENSKFIVSVGLWRGVNALDDYADDRAGATSRQGPRDQTLQAERDDLVATLGHHGGETTDENAEATEVGEAAERVGHDEPAARTQRSLRQIAQGEIGEKLVQDRLGAHQSPRH